MVQKLFKQRFKLALGVFLITLLTFYVNYGLIFQAPLVFENHLGFFLYSFIFSGITFIFTQFKTRVASIVFLVGWAGALINLYLDLLRARIETGGTIGAALGLLTGMMLVLILSVSLELIAFVVSRFRK